MLPNRHVDWSYANFSVDDQFDCALDVVQDESFDLEVAMSSSVGSKLMHARREEMDSLKKNQTSKLVSSPQESQAIGCKWVYKMKDDGRYKARLVANKFSRRKGIKYDKVFAPVVRHTTIQTLLVIVATHDKEVEQLDINATFMRGDLKVTIYMKQSK